MSYKGGIENRMRKGQWTCQAGAWRTRALGSTHSLAFFLDRSPGAAGPSAYRSSALLSGVQGSSQTVCSLGGFVFYPEMQRPPWLLDAALVPGVPTDVRMEGMVGDELHSHPLWTWVVPGPGWLRPREGLQL